MFGKPSSCQSAVRRHSNIIFCTKLSHLSFFLTEDQIIMALNGYKLLEAFLFCQCVCLCKLIGKTVGNSDIAGFSLFHDLVQALHNIVKRSLIIPHMVNIQIYIVQSQIFQTGIDHPFNMFLSGNSLLDFLRSPGEKFRSYYPIFPLCKIFYRPAYILFTGAALVPDSRIKKVNSTIQSFFNDLPGMFLVYGPAVLSVFGVSKAYPSHTDPGHRQI